MGVVVVGDVAHVIVKGPLPRTQLAVGDVGEPVAKPLAHVTGWGGVVHAPDHHGHEADLAVTDPAVVVLEVARRDDGGLAEIAVHCTFKMIVDFHLTIVPAAGTSEITFVHFVVPALGPRVEKNSWAFLKAA